MEHAVHRRKNFSLKHYGNNCLERRDFSFFPLRVSRGGKEVVRDARGVLHQQDQDQEPEGESDAKRLEPPLSHLSVTNCKWFKIKS